MSVKIIQDRLNQYQPGNQAEEENAIKEITQEIALTALSRSEFFKVAAFQGGTALRILYGLNRFSEDLDFALKAPDDGFDWEPYLKNVALELEAYGYQLKTQDRSTDDGSVKGAFLKDDSIGKVLVLKHRDRNTPKSLKIKVEIDANPPAGATFETKYIDFPVTVPIVVHDRPSLFAGKCHALLCRQWEKGRDWYDFLWYVGQKVQINLELLTHALEQAGPWQGRGITATKAWMIQELQDRIRRTDWEKQKADVARFLKQSDRDLLEHWRPQFFLDRVERLASYLADS